ncbi:unnamed protein product [Rhizophagus irregularis]|nr:unnamed protein product [Rhizophagus irregularis]
MLILITTLSTYCTLQERQKSPGPVVDDPGPLAPPPPPGPCKNCIDKCCAALITCINGPNPSLCSDGLKQCNLDCNMKGCKNMTYHFDCFPQKGPGPVVDDPGPLAPPPPPGPCKNCIDKCCAAFITCINGPNPSLCSDGLKQCNLDCVMKGCKNMTYHFDCFDPEPSAPPQKGPSPQDPGPQKGPSPQDPGSQKDPAGSQGSNSQQPPKGNNVM